MKRDDGTRGIPDCTHNRTGHDLGMHDSDTHGVDEKELKTMNLVISGLEILQLPWGTL
jgi:hypothetical protein